jgi:aspartate/methionine/tyrosine aminotransferase
MNPQVFALERYFARYEFATRYLLCSSDPESMSVRELLALEPGTGEALLDVWLGYTESRGSPELRRAIAALYELPGADGILVHAGAQEPIFAFMNVALAPGDHVVVQVPAYQSHYSIAEAAGAEVTRWESDLAGDGAPDPDDLARAIRPTTRAIVMTSPNNPTGYVFDRQRLDATIEIARKHGLWLFADEVYRGTERDPADRVPAVCDLYERGISLGAMAKAYGLAGLRIGWIATRDSSLYDRIATFKDYLTICNPAPSEYLATLALYHHDALTERVRRITAGNLDCLDAYFRRHAERWDWRRPRAGTTAFPRFLAGSTQRLCAELVERAGVLLLPSVAFDAGDDRVRIGYGRKNLPEALAAMDDYFAAVV